ncbi:MAG: hypothetical protein CFH44_00093 [Proteobacteria bacterium]|nr:MAG: hypothetical protein CFH44_00093 [Pseudomonadota bacterium]|tara:strand:- start:733 stop:906 length:174 start_codon:yes stop_codon:yes gene_type:complete
MDLGVRSADRRKRQIKIQHKNMRKSDRRKADKIDQNIYKAIMVLIPLVLILWALNIR